jgi:hypothetical protein
MALTYGSMQFHSAQKVSISRAHPRSTCPRNDFPVRGCLNHRPINSYSKTS